MKATLMFILVLFFFSCGQKQEAGSKATVTPKKESRYARLLSKYKDKFIDTLRVYSPEELTGEYEGLPIDSADARLFPEGIFAEHPAGTREFFAVYKFALDGNTEALITRTPSYYVPSSIKLFFYDKARDSITSYIELAESWGDAGDVLIKDAWIFKEQQQYVTFLMVQEQHSNTIENEHDTTVERHNFYHLLDLTRAGDTISKDQVELQARFRHLIDKASR